MGKLVIENLLKEFEGVTAVNSLSLTVENGEFLTVVGPSGCGKTTLLRMIAGFTDPTHGKIEIDGNVLYDSARHMHPVPPEKRDIGMVFQTYAVWPHMNVFHNVSYPLKLRRIPKKELRARTMEVLSLVHLDGYEKRMAFEMSGGQQQRVALARALVMQPRLLLLDEPFSNLDAVLREQMQKEIKEIQKKTGVTIVNVTHDQAEAMALSDRVAVMKDGKLIQYDTPRRIYEEPVNSFTASFIGTANILPVRRSGKGASGDGRMEVVLPGGSSLFVPYEKTKSEEGFLCFRAHEIEPSEDGAFAAVVTGAQYRGDSIRYQLLCGDGTSLQMLTGTEKAFAEGETVRLAIRSARWLSE